MAKLYRRVARRPGQMPGTVEFTGRRKTDEVVITVIDYLGEDFSERRVTDVRDCLPYRDTKTTTWINIDGLHDTTILKSIAEHFQIHPLVQEDIVNTHQRPKVHDGESNLYIVAHMLTVAPRATLDIESEQISLILGPNYIISFQERPGDVFDEVRERLRQGTGRLRTWGADYLCYALIDALVDHYFLALEKVGELIENLELKLLAHPDQAYLRQIHTYKRELILMRRTIWPLREVVGFLARTESDFIREHTGIYLRDVHDHTFRVADTLENFRDMLSGLQDLYLSSISNKMNEVMKVLTIVSTLFVPLTFITGVYGMNFKSMPELGWRWAYLATWIVMLALAGGMIAFFRRRKYL